MRNIVLIDMDNTMANVNRELQKKGYITDVYPSPVPKGVFEDGSIFREAKPIQPVIDVIRALKKDKGNHFIYITARSSKEKIHKITREWIDNLVGLSFPILYTNGLSKGKVLKEKLGKDWIKKYNWTIFEDAPHEIISYQSLPVDITFYIPEWKYNAHIDVGQKIAFSKDKDIQLVKGVS